MHGPGRLLAIVFFSLNRTTAVKALARAQANRCATIRPHLGIPSPPISNPRVSTRLIKRHLC